MTKKRFIGLSALVLVAILAALWALSRSWLLSKKEMSGRPNLIIISLDTLRADRLGFYGYKKQTSPFLDKLSSRGAVFENATSPTCWTLPAHVSMFSGLYPTSHGVTDVVKISKDTPLLAEMLQAKGYRTFGFPGGGYVSAVYGFDRGFAHYPRTKSKRHFGPEGGLGVAIRRAKEVLESLGKGDPYFLFLHTMDIHCPFNPPEPYYSMFKSDGAERVKTAKCIRQERSMRLSPEQVLFMSDRYDGGIRWADDNLAGFFSWLEAQDLLSNTYVFIVSDHGEEFGEHGVIGHKHSLHREVISVPFLLFGPGIKPKRYTALASVADITPTALELLNLPVPPYMQGISLAQFVRGRGREDALPSWRFSELGRRAQLRSNFSPARHLIADLEKDETKLYDLKSDPLEQNNIAAGQPERNRSLLEELFAFMDALSKPASEMESPDLDPETIQQLKTLGYL